MKISEIIALVVAFLGLAGAFQNFFMVDFSSKLVALAVGGSIALWVAAQRLTERIKVKSPPGFVTIGHRRLKRLAVAIVFLGIISVAFSAAASLVIRFYAINIEETLQGSGQIVFWIYGSRQVASEFTVLVPSSDELRWRPVDCAGGTSSRATTSVSGDWSESSEELKITNFSYPQCQGLSFSPGMTIDRLTFRPNPSTIEVLVPVHRHKYKLLIFTFGGVLWIVSICFVIFRSR